MHQPSRLVLAFGLLGVALLLFSAWGMKTGAGQRAFDEMAGMIPFFAGVAGGALLAIAVVLEIVRRARA